MSYAPRGFWCRMVRLLTPRRTRDEIAAEYDDHARFFTKSLETWRTCQRIRPGEPWTAERMRHCEETIRDAQEAAAWWRA